MPTELQITLSTAVVKARLLYYRRFFINMSIYELIEFLSIIHEQKIGNLCSLLFKKRNLIVFRIGIRNAGARPVSLRLSNTWGGMTSGLLIFNQQMEPIEPYLIALVDTLTRNPRIHVLNPGKTVEYPLTAVWHKGLLFFYCRGIRLELGQTYIIKYQFGEFESDSLPWTTPQL